ncbi:MAG: hypothetical protein JG781_2494 [Peptococcaceae bacterium]|jgi:hypothetical protein|nr:hypothetical protein [Peptococcaceae bacterium]
MDDERRKAVKERLDNIISNLNDNLLQVVFSRTHREKVDMCHLIHQQVLCLKVLSDNLKYDEDIPF